MVDICKKDVSLTGYKQKGGACCGTCSFSRHMFGGVYVCVRTYSKAAVGILDYCDLFERYEITVGNKEENS